MDDVSDDKIYIYIYVSALCGTYTERTDKRTTIDDGEEKAVKKREKEKEELFMLIR